VSKPLFLEHWTNIDAESMARYESMYQWSAAAEAFYRAAEIRDGQVVADFGSGPGPARTAIEAASMLPRREVAAVFPRSGTAIDELSEAVTAGQSSAIV
jgi:hypothetical protein